MGAQMLAIGCTISLHMTYYPEFSRLLNQALHRQDRSASWLAHRLRVSPSTVTRWLNHGTRPGAPEVVAQIVEILDVGEQRQEMLRAAGFAHQIEFADGTVRLPESQKKSPSLESRYHLPALPRSATPLIGRAAEIERLEAWLLDPDVQIITLVGPGGMGKTRVALALAAAQLKSTRFAQGAAFVDLAPLTSVEQIPAAVAGSVGLPLEREENEALSLAQKVLAFLRRRNLLLVLDNAEHLPDGAYFIADLANDATQIKILVTSRTPLRVPGEQLFPLRGLAHGMMSTAPVAVDTPAVALFQQAARRVRPDYQCSAEERAAVVEICRVVEGMPLAIELAASWVSTMPAGEILAAIGKSLRFLETDLRNVPARHRSMEAVFDATWVHLDESKRQMFAQCSVFRGGFTREALIAVAGVSLRDLRRLTDASLITYDPALDRYTVHELLRQYGALRLTEMPELQAAAQQAHSEFYLDFLAQQQDALKQQALQRDLLMVDVELENLRQAWKWAAVHDQAVRVVAAFDAVGLFFRWRGLAEEGESAYAAAADMLMRVGAKCHLARALAWQAHFARILGRQEMGRQLLLRCRNLLTDPALSDESCPIARAHVFMELGAEAAGQDVSVARDYYNRSLALFQEADELRFAAEVLLGLGHLCLTQGDFAGQRAYVEAALELYRALGHARGTAAALSMLADIDSYRGRSISGLNLGLESLAAFRALDDPIGTATCLSRLGYTYMNLGDVVNARQVITESAGIFAEMGARRDEVIAHVFLSAVELMAGDYDRSHQAAHHALSLATDLSDQFVLAVALGFCGWADLTIGDLDNALALLRKAVVLTELTGAHMDGTRAHAVLARAQWENGQARQAQVHCSRALRLCLQVGDPWSLATALTSTLILLAGGEDPVRACELYGMLRQDSLCAASRWFEDAVAPHLAIVATVLPAEAMEAAVARGADFDVTETVRALVAEVEALGWTD